LKYAKKDNYDLRRMSLFGVAEIFLSSLFCAVDRALEMAGLVID
jgi:hypothetical protein